MWWSQNLDGGDEDRHLKWEEEEKKQKQLSIMLDTLHRQISWQWVHEPWYFQTRYNFLSKEKCRLIYPFWRVFFFCLANNAGMLALLSKIYCLFWFVHCYHKDLHEVIQIYDWIYAFINLHNLWKWLRTKMPVLRIGNRLKSAWNCR